MSAGDKAAAVQAVWCLSVDPRGIHKKQKNKAKHIFIARLYWAHWNDR